jgi:allophanate hydrolase subunit 2
MGMRLKGPLLEHARGFNITSDGTAPGSIQVPGDGLPIVLLADRQTTGGYPKIGCVISADLPTVARLRPGNTIRFALATLEQAAEARRERESWFARFRSHIKRSTLSGIIDPITLHTQNLVSGVVGPDDATELGK